MPSAAGRAPLPSTIDFVAGERPRVLHVCRATVELDLMDLATLDTLRMPRFDGAGDLLSIPDRIRAAGGRVTRGDGPTVRNYPVQVPGPGWSDDDHQWWWQVERAGADPDRLRALFASDPAEARAFCRSHDLSGLDGLAASPARPPVPS